MMCSMYRLREHALISHSVRAFQQHQTVEWFFCLLPVASGTIIMSPTGEKVI